MFASVSGEIVFLISSYQLHACLFISLSLNLTDKYYFFKVFRRNMYRSVVLIIHLCVLSTTVGFFASGEPQDDPGEPLFLTPYLEQGKIDEARRLRLAFHH